MILPAIVIWVGGPLRWRPWRASPASEEAEEKAQGRPVAMAVEQPAEPAPEKVAEVTDGKAAAAPTREDA